MEITLSSENSYNKLKKYLKDNNIDNIFVVSYHFKEKPKVIKYLEELDIKMTIFSDYKPNPTYEQVCDGVEKFRKTKSKFILALGGGSALDVAKCIKVFSTMDDNVNFLKQDIVQNDIMLCAVPTTAGTGSEATRYAVIYYEGNKQSVTSDYIIPDIVLFDSNLLKSLSIDGKKATVLDAFSHSIESMWSVNSTEESKKYAKKSIKIILDNIDKYLDGDEKTYPLMLKAANLAGKAINITQTTAGHAMCYKLTSIYGIAHGHAACLINSILFPYMIDNLDKCSDVRGEKYLEKTFIEISKALGCNSLEEAKKFIIKLLDKLNFYDVNFNYDDLDTLTSYVNTTRLKNNPIKLDKEDIKIIYERLFNEIERRK